MATTCRFSHTLSLSLFPGSLSLLLRTQPQQQRLSCTTSFCRVDKSNKCRGRHAILSRVADADVDAATPYAHNSPECLP